MIFEWADVDAICYSFFFCCRFIHYVSSKDGSLKHGPGNSITGGGGGGGGVDPKSVCPPVAPAAAAGGPKTLVAQATKEAPERGDQVGVGGVSRVSSVCR